MPAHRMPARAPQAAASAWLARSSQSPSGSPEAVSVDVDLPCPLLRHLVPGGAAEGPPRIPHLQRGMAGSMAIQRCLGRVHISSGHSIRSSAALGALHTCASQMPDENTYLRQRCPGGQPQEVVHHVETCQCKEVVARGAGLGRAQGAGGAAPGADVDHLAGQPGAGLVVWAAAEKQCAGGDTDFKLRTEGRSDEGSTSKAAHTHTHTGTHAPPHPPPTHPHPPTHREAGSSSMPLATSNQQRSPSAASEQKNPTHLPVKSTSGGSGGTPSITSRL